MYSINDLIGLKVYLVEGDYIGEVKDLTFSYKEKALLGLVIKRKNMRKKRLMCYCEKILTINRRIVVSGIDEVSGVLFDDIKGLDVVNRDGEILGLISDVFIDPSKFSILGLALSKGIVKDIYRGKEIITFEKILIGESEILFWGSGGIGFKRKGSVFYE